MAEEEKQVTRHDVEESRSLFTPFNMIAGIFLIVGVILAFKRFTGGLGAVTNLDHNNPWGFWIGFDLLTGVALAAGGYVTAACVEIFGMKKYHAALRPAILTGFLGYSLVVFALLFDVGRPWRLPYPFIVNQGVTSVMFEVGACVALYLTVLFLEFSPAALEWLGMKKVRKLAIRLTMVLTFLGVILSTLHQSSLGAMYLIAPSKLHPLWYSPYLPVFFFVSSIAAGLSMVVFESTLSYKNFRNKMDEEHKKSRNAITIGFGRAASLVLAGYFAIKIFGVALGNHWNLLFTNMGLWFQVEMLGFVLLPCFLYAIGVREKNVKLIRFTAFWTVLGIVLNRFNVSLVAFNWQLPMEARYFPSWMEIGITLFIVTVGLVVFRFIVTRMPIFYEHPEYSTEH
ncbi:MAG: Ni/Fe-hydrogenase cytochrome b subunit [candidate division Zixibacteria bacterium]|nr:Ni/Fe-hydrogenase cytochrome b subunit [candidate division Zixibacteria bacterium]